MSRKKTIDTCVLADIMRGMGEFSIRELTKEIYDKAGLSILEGSVRVRVNTLADVTDGSTGRKVISKFNVKTARNGTAVKYRCTGKQADRIKFLADDLDCRKSTSLALFKKGLVSKWQPAGIIGKPGTKMLMIGD